MILRAHADCRTGYGLVATEIHRELAALGQTELVPWSDDRQPHVLHCPAIAAADFATSNTKVIYTAWESTTWPESFCALVRRRGDIGIAVVSEWCRQTLLEQHGIRSVVARHGVASVVSTAPKVTNCDFQVYINGVIDGGGCRRNFQDAVKIFSDAIGQYHGTKLVLRLPTGGSKAAHWMVPCNGVVEVRRGWVERQQLLDEIAESHVFLNVSRSEAWGRLQQEATELGTPVIGPLYSGLAEHLSEQNAYTTMYRVTPAFGLYAGHWCEQDHSSAVDRLRQAYLKQGELYAKSSFGQAALYAHRPSQGAARLRSLWLEHS